MEKVVERQLLDAAVEVGARARACIHMRACTCTHMHTHACMDMRTHAHAHTHAQVKAGIDELDTRLREVAWVTPHTLDSTATLPSLEQLQQNSDETNLRLGCVPHALTMLRTFPLLFEARRFVVSDVQFFLKDLFMGARGEASCVS